MAVLEVEDLNISFNSPRGRVRAVNGVSFNVHKNETVGIIGETGSGKSVTTLSILRLLPAATAVVSGNIIFQGRSLLNVPEREMRMIRGSEISMIFQEPMTSLNPVLRVGYQIGEVLRVHQRFSKENIYKKTVEVLKSVKMPDPERTLRQYPHELSGGMRQRVMIAIAMVCQPNLLIADEPTTALDVTIQAQVLALMKELICSVSCSVIFVSHDLGVISKICQRILVMYAGKIVEEASLSELSKQPYHPYTEALIKSIPRLRNKMERFISIPGTVPNLIDGITGCDFSSRCNYVQAECKRRKPQMTFLLNGRRVACHFPLV